MATDLAKAVKRLRDKQAPYTDLWRYYEGPQPLVYSSARLKEAFRLLDAHFEQNWCTVIVDSVMDRLDLPSFIVRENEELTERLNRLWYETQLNLDSDDAHLDALVTHEAFIIAWRERADGSIDAYYNDARMVHVEYDAERPRLKRWAAKWWRADQGRYRLTLYYADHVEYYQSTGSGENAPAWLPDSANGFRPIDPETGEVVELEGYEWPRNPFGRIPVFHLQRSRSTNKSELSVSVRSMQDAVNKLLADMMVAAEYGAFKQRYIISNAELGTLKNAPNEIWEIPAGDGVSQDTTVGEFGETSLDNFLQGIDNLATSIGIVSRTPKHYFFKDTQREISGEALYALEGPLIKKVSRYIERFTRTWQDLAAFLLELDGETVDPLDIVPVWVPPNTIQPRTRAEIRQFNNNSGIPLETTLREEGMSQAEIDQILQEKAKAEAASVASLAQGLVAQQRRFDQGNDGDEETE